MNKTFELVIPTTDSKFKNSKEYRCNNLNNLTCNYPFLNIALF